MSEYFTMPYDTKEEFDRKVKELIYTGYRQVHDLRVLSPGEFRTNVVTTRVTIGDVVSSSAFLFRNDQARKA